MRRSFLLIVSFVGTLCEQTITICAGTMLDGNGGVQKNVRLTIQRSKILRVDPGGAGAVKCDLSGLTLMPGWIDTHIHLNGHFNRKPAICLASLITGAFVGVHWERSLGENSTFRSIKLCALPRALREQPRPRAADAPLRSPQLLIAFATPSAGIPFNRGRGTGIATRRS